MGGIWGHQKGRGLGLELSVGLAGCPCATYRYIESYTSCVAVQAFQKAVKRRR